MSENPAASADGKVDPNPENEYELVIKPSEPDWVHVWLLRRPPAASPGKFFRNKEIYFTGMSPVGLEQSIGLIVRLVFELNRVRLGYKEGL